MDTTLVAGPMPVFEHDWELSVPEARDLQLRLGKRVIEENRLDVDFMITHRFKFEDAKDAFDLVDDYRDGVIKAILEFE